MKKTYLIFLLMLAFSFVTEAQILKKNSNIKTMNVQTLSPTMFIELNGVILELYDREGQQDGIQLSIMEDELMNRKPRDPEITFIHLPEIGERAYKFAESLQEASQESDGYTIIKMKWSELMKNRRTKYN